MTTYTIETQRNNGGDLFIEVSTHENGVIVRSTVLLDNFPTTNEDGSKTYRTTDEYVMRRFDLLSAMFADSDSVMVL